MQANWIFRSEATLKSSETPFRAQRDGACQRPSNNVGYTVVLPLLPFGELPRWGAKNVLPLNLIALRSREIFVIRGKAVNVRKPQAGNLLSRNLRASPYLYSAALLIFMRRTTPIEPFEPIEPVEPLEPVIPRYPGHEPINHISCIYAIICPHSIL